MRILVMFAGLMLCVGVGNKLTEQEKTSPKPDYEQRWVDGKCFSIPKDLWVGGTNPILPCESIAKREKVQPCTLPVSPKIADMACGEIWTAQGWRDFSEYLKLVTQPLPFDIPAKEWDIQQWDGSLAIVIPHYSCKDVAPDWKQRVLLDSADGKHHCYAFYLLEQKP